MMYLVVGLALLAAAAIAYAAVITGDNKVKDKIISDQKAALGKAAQDLLKMNVERDEAVVRRELIILNLKAELSKMEADLASCSTPAAVRDRLSKLFP